ncbi:hypothetical protein NW766_011173 [Fusarium irregulare]|uniref:Uncharacterized protein n=1 Tax=Fusarium irregulare TaxID=2494466 RepID=A0A9W8U5X5_9HYPO|nr:hypothetical protein NW766_011173 [Fusarium irregulare]
MTFDVMVHCEVFLQTEWCPRAEYPITKESVSSLYCSKCHPPPWQRSVEEQQRENVEMQPQEDVDMQSQEDVDMQLEDEARSSDKTLSVERAEPGLRFQELIDEVTRRSAAEDEQNHRNRREESSRTTLSPEFYYTTRAGRRIPAPRGTPPASPTPAGGRTRRTRRTHPYHPAT